MANNIKVFARLKPSKNIKQELFKHEDQALYIASHNQVPTEDHDPKHYLRFNFSHVFGVDSSQKQVFQAAAKDIIEAFFNGYNGTIFAYGQTSAGKTYTIQGPAEGLQDCHGSEDAGLIPQSLSLIFHKIEQHSQPEAITVHISFFEIYRETAYDLLGCFLFNGSKKNREMPKVLITYMGGKGCCHLHGLSSHAVTSEKEAVSLYKWGLANQKAAYTTVNQRSSRSHSILTVALAIQERGSEIIIRSKLHLVDLAGSERVWKSHVPDISRPKFFNLSLHHLESVVTALQKFHPRNTETDSKKNQTGKCLNRGSSAFLPQPQNTGAAEMPRVNALLKSASTGQLGRQNRQSPFGVGYNPCYIPYRNSLLTMVLQDSLGGNCNAAMIALLSLEEENLPETILTCRFAQKVARVVNEPRQNVEVDKDVVIKRLQTQLGKLHYELTSYKAPQQVSIPSWGDLGHEQQCINVMRSFLAGRINDPVAHGVNTCNKFRTALLQMRQIFIESRACAFSLEDDGMESVNESDSGLRTGSGSDTASPLVSEWENDCNGHAQLPPARISSADASLHSVTENSTISLNNDHKETTPIEDSPPPEHPSVTLQPCETGKEGASTQTNEETTIEERKRDGNISTEGERIQPVEKSPAIYKLELQRETLLNSQNSKTSLNNDHKETTPIEDRPFPQNPSVPRQPSETVKKEASTQTNGETTFEERKRHEDICTEGERIQPVEKSLVVSRLELQRGTLLNKSKMIESRLIEQRARLVMIVKQGVVPEELENEKIVEMQLQKRQRDVIEQLSQVMKKLADWKGMDQEQQSLGCSHKQAVGTKNDEPSCCAAPSSQIKDSAQISKELELKEASTRQKLLACREQMRNMGISLASVSHGKFCQSTTSVSGCGSRQTSISYVSPVTLRSQGDVGENMGQCSPTPPPDRRRPVFKPPRLRSRLSADFLQANKNGLNSCSSSPRRRFSAPEKVIHRPGKSVVLRSEGKLVEYMSTSHKKIYQSSSFPRWPTGGSGQVYVMGLNSTSQKVPVKQGTKVRDDKRRFSSVS